MFSRSATRRASFGVFGRAAAFFVLGPIDNREQRPLPGWRMNGG